MRESSSRAWTPSIVALTSLLALVMGSLTLTATPASAAPRFGGTVFERPGETYAEAYQRVTRTYGGNLDAIRLFFPGAPSPWKRIRAKVRETPVVVSFRMDPRAVASGRYDRSMRRWFASAPTNRPTYWSYWHEPENDGVNKRAYRRAWRHLDKLADRARNPQLRSTLILMCWTLDRASGRNWRHYYAGPRAIRVLAFDCYNTGRKSNVYKSPRAILKKVVRLARRVDKPWGVAEFGSTSIPAAGGHQGRARWLRSYASYVQRRGGEFATYFDSHVGYDYRLHDRPSRIAWRNIVQR
jgi:hypothetical protein